MRTPQPRFPAYVGLPLTPPSLPARSRAEWHQWRTPPCCCSWCDAGAYPTALPRTRAVIFRAPRRGVRTCFVPAAWEERARESTPRRARRARSRAAACHTGTRGARARAVVRGREGRERGGGGRSFLTGARRAARRRPRDRRPTARARRKCGLLVGWWRTGGDVGDRGRRDPTRGGARGDEQRRCGWRHRRAHASISRQLLARAFAAASRGKGLAAPAAVGICYAGRSLWRDSLQYRICCCRSFRGNR